MALITCSDCKNQISSFAPQCPFCGCPAHQWSANEAVTETQQVRENTPPIDLDKNTDSEPSLLVEPVAFQTNSGEKVPKEWLVEAIIIMGMACFVGFFLFTSFLVVPIGIVAMYYGMQVTPKWYGGFKDEAKSFSDKAKLWVIIATLIFVGNLVLSGMAVVFFISKFFS